MNHARQNHDSAVGIEPRIEDQSLQLVGGAPLGRRHVLDDRLQHLGHADAGLGADAERVGSVQADGALDHLLGARDVSAGQIDFVDDGNDLQSVVDRNVGVGQCLRFDALRGVDHQQRAFAGGQRARDFVAEIDVPGGVDQVELVGLAVGRRIHHADGVSLDGDAAFTLQVHGVEHLGLHLARR